MDSSSLEQLEHAALALCERPLWMFDPERERIVWANPAAVALFRVEGLVQLTSAEPGDLFAQRPPRLIDGESVTERVTLLPRSQPFSARCAFTGTRPAGGPLMVFCEVKEVLPSSLDADARLRAMSLQVPIGVLLVTTDGRCLFVNQRWCEIAKTNQEDSLGRGWLKLLDSDERDRLFREWGRIDGLCREVRVETRLRHPDGTVVWVTIDTVPLLGEKGRVEGYLSTVTNDLGPVDSEQRYAAVFAYAADAHMLIDENGVVLDCNQGAVELAGAPSKSALVGASPAQFSPQSLDLEPAQQTLALLDLARKHGTHRFEWVSHGAGGRITVVEVALSCIQSGEKTVFFASAHDATERKMAELAIVRSREEALAASRLKSQFLANMSHEIRTPMNGVLGMLHLALSTELTGEQREFLQAAHASAEGLLEIINDILDVSKIEAGKLKLDRVELAVQDVLRASLQSPAMRAHAKNLELIVRLDPRVPEFVVGDPVRLRQVLTNLLSNAVKFTDSGHVQLALELQGPSDARSLAIEVVDTGIGIADERLASIFESFQQADGSTTRRFGGTGLGLTICRELVAMMGGRLQVESKLGHGSRFYFLLPLETPASARPSAERERLLVGRVILVVDDHPLARQALITDLEELGASVLSAASPTQAFAVVERSSLEVDTAFIDHELGSQSGLELARLLRRYPACRTTRFTLLRSQERVSRTQLSDAGFAFVLDKPVLRIDLVRSLGMRAGHDPSARFASHPTREALLTSTVGPLSILLVEDHPVNAHFIRTVLQRQGHRVVHALNGVKGLSAFENGSFDLVLMDVQMPEMDGLEATRRIRAFEQSRGIHVPIIALTANAMKGDQEACLAAGMDHYIAKPVDLTVLQQSIARLAGRKDAVEVTPQEEKPPEVVLDHARHHDAPFHRAELLQRASGDPSFMGELISIFLSTHKEMQRDLERAVALSDAETVGAAAHRLKGALQLICAAPSVALATELERAARTSHRELFPALMVRLSAEMRRLRAALVDGRERPGA